MRTIKFKAKRIDNDEWVEGYFYKECDNTYIIENKQKEPMLNRNVSVLVDPTSVCQYTGLKDENGQEVWEHDILKFSNLEVEVVFYKGCFHAKIDDSFNYSFSALSITDGQLACWCVIGNKFDRKVRYYD